MISKKLTGLIGSSLLIIVSLPFIIEFSRPPQHTKDTFGLVKAIVTTERSYVSKGIGAPYYRYVYEFYVDGVRYEGISSKEYIPGDSILIEYMVDNPIHHGPEGYYK